MPTTTTTAQPITEAATRDHGAPRRLLWPAPGVRQQAAFAASASAKPDHAGYDVRQLRMRLLAAGQPLWGTPVGIGTDYGWCARQPDSGAMHGSAMHIFDHKADDGQRTACVAKRHAGGACKADAPNKADGKRRARYDGAIGTDYRLPSGTGKATRGKAAAELRRGIAWLRSVGYSRASVEATRSIADALGIVGHDADGMAAALGTDAQPVEAAEPTTRANGPTDARTGEGNAARMLAIANKR